MLDYLARTANRNPHKTGVSGSNPESPTYVYLQKFAAVTQMAAGQLIHYVGVSLSSPLASFSMVALSNSMGWYFTSAHGTTESP
jgi:hypothetical protein